MIARVDPHNLPLVDLVEIVDQIDLNNVRRFELDAAQELARRMTEVLEIFGPRS